ncbi:MAG: aspartate kinase [Oscillospiraceae bacterium]
MIIVAKFGGSSLADSRQFKKVRDIVHFDKTRSIVVLSAPGKRSGDDHKITDLLYLCHAHLKYGVSYSDIFELIKERFFEIAAECEIELDLELEFAEIASKMNKHMSTDYLASRGEYLAAKLMAKYIGYEFVDASELIFFGYDGKVDFQKTNEAIARAHESFGNIAIPGFYGSMPDGKIRTFSRGGSDITGAIAAAAVNANTYENWTDVAGILMADPHIVENPRAIERITYSELRELSYMGAEVLHEDAVLPVRNGKIPLNIRNTNSPNSNGTYIQESFEENAEELSRFITGISGKKHFSIITLAKSGMSGGFGTVRKALEATEKFSVNVEHVLSGVDSFSLVVSTDAVSRCIYDLISEIKRLCEPDTIGVADGISLVAVVGRRMAQKPGISGKLFRALGDNGINIRMIDQGADEINIIVGVNDSDFQKTIRVLYNSFA